MQIRGKILTIAGIVLIFGYFIQESFKSPASADPNKIIMVGNDTLGRDWGAMADQKEKEKMQQSQKNIEEDASSAMSETKSISSEDPFQREKLNQDNYSTIESPDGREIITGYNRPEEQGNLDINSQSDNYQTRHQREKGQITEEPTIIYKE